MLSVIHGKIAVLLENAESAHGFLTDPAGGQCGTAAVDELDTGIDDIFCFAEYRNTHHIEAFNFGIHHGQQQVDIVDHQIQHHTDFGAAGRQTGAGRGIFGDPLGFDETGFAGEKIEDGKVYVTVSLDDLVIRESVTLPCVLCAETDINSPRLPSYKVQKTVTDDMVRFISFAEFEDQDANHYGLNGSATQVERIFPPEKNTEKHAITGDATAQADGIFALLAARKLL